MYSGIYSLHLICVKISELFCITKILVSVHQATALECW